MNYYTYLIFTDAWEQERLGDVFTSLQNIALSRVELSEDEGIAKNIHYGDVLIKYGSVLDVKKESVPMVKELSKISKLKSSYLKDGDIVFADTAEDETVGKCCELKNIEDEIIVSGLHTMPFRPNSTFSSMYLGYYLNSNSFHCQLFSLMQGIKVTSISKSAIKSTKVLYPKSLKEQELIAQTFSSLDSLLASRQRELEKLKNIKKALLQKMFV